MACKEKGPRQAAGEVLKQERESVVWRLMIRGRLAWMMSHKLFGRLLFGPSMPQGHKQPGKCAAGTDVHIATGRVWLLQPHPTLCSSSSLTILAAPTACRKATWKSLSREAAPNELAARLPCTLVQRPHPLACCQFPPQPHPSTACDTPSLPAVPLSSHGKAVHCVFKR